MRFLMPILVSIEEEKQMTAKREIGIGSVRVGRNQRDGSWIEVKSKAIEKFFAGENERAYGCFTPLETRQRAVGYSKAYEIPNVQGLEDTVNCLLRCSSDYQVNAGNYGFLRAVGLSDGLKIPITSPMTANQAKELSEKIAHAMQALYINYMRNYLYEVSVRADVQIIDPTEIQAIEVSP
jgi:hypothetical protein